MSSSYSNLKIELIGTGDQSGTWGNTTNTNLGTALGEAITGSADVAYSSAADVTVTLTNTNAAQTARNLRLNITESGAGVGYAGNLILGSGILDRVVPIVSKWSEKQISGLEKQQGVVKELEIIGLGLTTSLTNLAVELAVQYLKRVK